MSERETVRPMIEIEIGDEKRKIYLKIDDEEDIWIDLHGLPESAVLCALFDGGPMFTDEVGDESSDERRSFVRMEWAINDWGGDKEFVEALKKRREMTLKDLPRLKEKYWKK